MSSSISRITSVTRWLLVVVGCVRLASAQPMSAAEPSPAPRSEQTIIYPKGTAPSEGSSTVGSPDTKASSPWFAVSAVLLAVAGGWVLLQRRRGLAPLIGKSERKLSVEESKSLGNRQYLVVASYEGRKFLLGITPERIQMLSEVSPRSGEVES